MGRLKRTSYAHQAGDVGEDDKEGVSVESEEENEKEEGNQS